MPGSRGNPPGAWAALAARFWKTALPDAWWRTRIWRTQGATYGNYKHGRYTAEAIASRSWLKQLTRDVRVLTKRLRQP
jgi:hypothetical protein